MPNKTLSVRVKAEVTGADKIAALGGNLSRVGGALTLGVTTPLLAAGAASFAFASDLEEASSKAATVYGDASDEIVKASEDMDDAWSQADFLDTAGTFGALLTNMEFTKDEAADLSVEWLKLSQDMASFHNTDPAASLGAIQSALAGEFEPLKQFGVMLNASTIEAKALEMGLWDGEGAISAHARALVIQAELLRQQPAVLGDYARTADGAANSQRNLTANFTDAAAALGQELLPVGTQLIQLVSGWVKAFQTLSPETRAMIVQIAAVAAAVGPVLLIGGKLIQTFVAVGKGFQVLSAIVSANPWVLLIAATVALVALIVANWDSIVKVITDAWAVITDAAGAVGEFIGDTWDAIVDIFRDAATAIAGVGGRIFRPISRGFDAAIGVVKGIWNAFARWWNSIQLSVPAIDVPFVGTVGGFTIGLPDLPQFAAGGIVTRPTLGILGEAGPEAIVPLNQMGPSEIHYHSHLTVQGDLVARNVSEAEDALLRVSRFSAVGGQAG